jgi:CrcB protein
VIRLALVALGGALGAVARYGVSGWIARATRTSPFPYGTLTVNLLGSLALGLLMGLATGGVLNLAPRLRIALAIGFLGAFTTFSTFSYETLESLRVGDLRIALLNVLISVVGALAACWLGLGIAERL